jgi:hypothetical protein
MAPKRRKAKRRKALEDNAERWLRGEDCGFYEIAPDADKRLLWDEYGNKKLFEWTEGQWRPHLKEAAD